MTPLFYRLTRLYTRRGHRSPRGKALTRILDLEMQAYVWRARNPRNQPKPPRYGALWTEAEVRFLLSNFRYGNSLTALAERMGRPASGVKTRLWRLGILERERTGFTYIYSSRWNMYRIQKHKLARGQVIDLTSAIPPELLVDGVVKVPENYAGKRAPR